MSERADELDREAALTLLREGSLEPLGRIATASNATLLCAVSLDDDATDGRLSATCVYKPIRGEAPLWDFPDGTLAGREVAAYVLSDASGWGVVPPTVMRGGPYGRGMVQLWMEADDEVDVVELIRRGDPALRPMAVFDAIVNNADRKAGHILAMPGGAIHGVDHGVCFAVEPKLRTVLWGWMGTPFAPDEIAVMRRLRSELDGPLARRLAESLAPGEVAETARRVERLLADGCFPRPDPDRPAIPWPWY